ncbi:MAG: UDP-3-O-(3-hydroxymyristoyl)glucosamine N-acyltransferase [Clostridium sp.]|nr:UDP-3-O-(3-hydroxymyristoyl)glucosamine N-acyltransferase [Clostridium sp.]
MEFTAAQLAEIVNGTVEGDGEKRVSTIAKIEEGRPGAISFLSNPRYEKYIYTTESSVVLVRRDFVAEHPVKATLIRVDDPYATVARLLTMVSEMMTPKKSGVEQPSYVAQGVEVPEGAYIGAFAYVGAGARLGRNVKIYPQAYVGDGVEIGDDSVIYAGAKIYHGCRIGCRCIIHSGAVIGADGFGFAPVDGSYRKIPQIGNVVISDDVEIGANTTVDRATMGSTVIERGVKLDNLIQIAHNCHVGESTVMAAQAGVAGSAKVGDHCMIGGQVGVAGHITVGARTEIAAQSGIHKSVPEDQRLFGSPAIDMRDYMRKEFNIKQIPDIERRLSALEKRDGDKK